MFRKLKELGPGILVAAAFIGPGTVTTASITGAATGYTLLWAVLFSIIATIFLQEMSVRLGVVANLGVGDALRKKTQHSFWRIPVILLVISAIVIGNAAYEAGNITGAVLGFPNFFSSTINPLVLIVASVAFLLLFSGKYKLIEKAILVLVSIMGIVFLITAILLKPDFQQVFKGLFIPSLSEDTALLVVGIIGTTVVPYNLFLHASTAKEKWKDRKSLAFARLDTILSILLGGIITMAILIVSAIAFEGQAKNITDINDLALQLEPLLGNWSSYFIAFGFLAAGVSSAITAPLAASYATAEILGWKQDLKSKKLRLVWIPILLLGVFFSSLGYKPTSIILFSQVANGLLLPIIALFLVWIVNDKNLLKNHVNNFWLNLISGIVILISIGLGLKSILSALGYF
ncbi:Nramp family divalent metal transporter [Mesonia maritima]|uniref:NRAMP (Natural resistance-associated macrophage protein)-like metal ion transporter n=1 Tax=Mesonia maritima TaxID=1793873 RepID=A0ABU1K491_9FLAO|nr:Nramp family divalent metal transporter [Mesonia maritima]MDR6300070.1 NRAMP (natural resistance-associated macrophage protein)-like metal ion transporter [Mesonia maritima]